MRGKWNGLQALVREYCPCAYYVHCFAHRLQLALVLASTEIIPVHQFFSNLVFTINVVCASSKRHDELQKAKADEIQKLLDLGEIGSGSGLNQGIIEDLSHTTHSQRGDADTAYGYLQSFEFVFILPLMKELMGKTNDLSKALQKKSQDILNAMDKGNFFCNKLQIDLPNMEAPYTSTRYRPRKKDLHVTFGHYYQVDLFNATLDKQLHELNSRFNEETIELLSLSSSLTSKEINVDEICLLVEKYYPQDFSDQEKIQLPYQLEIFNIEKSKNINLSGVSTISDLCKSLVDTKKRETYYLVDRVIRLILTLPVSTATTERGFSAMKIFKNRLRNKMSDDYLANSLVIYIEKEIAENFDLESIIDEFKNLKGHCAEL
ncbi:hypothetical protein E3N88_21051 [Mikania micrantha]|uniref:HAT C-terminal dimerisation domain-containing protein n=1 Tax=Mikania micrantha TaxID=192012 RepID=A0A5N6NLJ5_9ASTR|nr:hypothetical protein E3N88_21051 [Mikania micrantha]